MIRAESKVSISHDKKKKFVVVVYSYCSAAVVAVVFAGGVLLRYCTMYINVALAVTSVKDPSERANRKLYSRS